MIEAIAPVPKGQAQLRRQRGCLREDEDGNQDDQQRVLEHRGDPRRRPTDEADDALSVQEVSGLDRPTALADPLHNRVRGLLQIRLVARQLSGELVDRSHDQIPNRGENRDVGEHRRHHRENPRQPPSLKPVEKRQAEDGDEHRQQYRNDDGVGRPHPSDDDDQTREGQQIPSAWPEGGFAGVRRDVVDGLH